MTAKTGFPTLRLIRESMGKLNVEGLVPGTVKELKKEDVYSLLDI
jgi:23S rRNA pseudouridine2457 synthase